MPIIYTLGQGLDSITGEGKEDTIFVNEILSSQEGNDIQNKIDVNQVILIENNELGKNLMKPLKELKNESRRLIRPFDKVPPVYARRKQEGIVELDVKHVSNHHEALKVLGVSGNISLTGPYGNASADVKFANTINFSSDEVTILVIGKFVSHLDTLPKHENLTLNREKFALALTNPKAFIESHGDHVVTEVKCGGIFYATVTIHHVSQKNALNFEAGLRCKLGPTSMLGLEGRVESQSTKLLDRVNITIKIEHLGIPGLGIPDINCSLEDFTNYIKKFNDSCVEAYKLGQLSHPIGYTTRPYSALISEDTLRLDSEGTLIESRDGKDIANNLMKMTIHGKLAKELLSELDILLGEAKCIINTVKRIQKTAMELVSELDIERQIKHMNNLLKPLEVYRDIVYKSIRTIFSCRTDLEHISFVDTCEVHGEVYSIKNVGISQQKNNLSLFSLKINNIIFVKLSS